MTAPALHEAVEREARQALTALARPHARLLEEGAGRYAVRTSADRRRRPPCVIGADAFAALCRDGALSPAGQGAWVLARGAPAPRREQARAGRPGVLPGVRAVMQPDGSLQDRAANLGESPLDWLARRKDAQGNPLLSRREHAAGERLRADCHAAGALGPAVMDWTAPPRGSTPRGPAPAPAEARLFARERLHAALSAVGPGLKEMVERVCLAESTLEAAERALGHPRRSGRALLKLGLQRAADFYGLG